MVFKESLLGQILVFNLFVVLTYLPSKVSHCLNQKQILSVSLFQSLTHTHTHIFIIYIIYILVKLGAYLAK